MSDSVRCRMLVTASALFFASGAASAAPEVAGDPVEAFDQAASCSHTGVVRDATLVPDYSLGDRGSAKPYRVVCRYFIIRRSDGSGDYDESHIDDWMRDMNYGYRDTPFVFVREPGVVYIDRDDYYSDLGSFNEIHAMMRNHEAPGVVNFFIAPLLFGGQFDSTTSFANPRGHALRHNQVGHPTHITTPIHDTGHMFGLWHPYESRFGLECADGSNAATAGDLLVGTPASPAVFSANTTATGVYFGTDIGPCPGDIAYAPHTKNYMEARWTPGNILRSEWLPSQVDRMVEFLLTVQSDLLGPDRPDVLVDCDGDGIDDIDAILAGEAVDVNQDMIPDSCQTFPEAADLLVVGMNGNTTNRPRYYDGDTGDYRGTIWNGYTYTHQARYGPDGFIYVPRLYLVTRLDPKTGRTHDNFIDGIAQGAVVLVDILHTDDGRVLTLDNNTTKISAYDSVSGEFLHEVAQLSTVGMTSVKFMEFGPDGNIYVVGNGAQGNTIQRVDPQTGALLGSFITPGAGGLSGGQGLVFHGDSLYVSNAFGSSVVKYDAVTGDPQGTFVSPGSGGLSNPHSLRFGPDGHLYVASRNANSVKKYDGTTGAYLGDHVSSSGDLDQPTGILFIEAPACAADMNADGRLDFFDISDFLIAFNSGDPAADFAEPNGSFNFFDVAEFISQFNAGCP